MTKLYLKLLGKVSTTCIFVNCSALLPTNVRNCVFSKISWKQNNSPAPRHSQKIQSHRGSTPAPSCRTARKASPHPASSAPLPGMASEKIKDISDNSNRATIGNEKVHECESNINDPLKKKLFIIYQNYIDFILVDSFI